MDFQIFYSWQSDLPNATNRGLIQKALEIGIEKIDGGDISVEPVIERDTKGLPGSPSIVDAIFSKIESSDAFVADISIINQGSINPADPDSPPRRTPNPNVLFELGYAAKMLGWDRIILIFNLSSGDPQLDLPFDLRPRRRTTYRSNPDDSDRSESKKDLALKLKIAITDIILQTPRKQLNEAATGIDDLANAVQAIENRSPGAKVKVRKYLAKLVANLQDHNPRWDNLTPLDEQLIIAVTNSREAVLEFQTFCAAFAHSGDLADLEEVHRFLEIVLNKFDRPAGDSSPWIDQQFDFWRFTGYELFVSFCAALIAEKKFELIGEFLSLQYHLAIEAQSGRNPNVPFENFSEPIELLFARQMRLKTNYTSPQGELLSELYKDGAKENPISLESFASADIFLLIRNSIHRQNKYSNWIPVSSIYLKLAPRFMTDASSAKGSRDLLVGLGVPDVLSLKLRLATASEELRSFYPTSFRAGSLISQGDIDRIPSKL